MSATNPFQFDMTRFPVVLLTAVGDLTPEQLDEHLLEYRKLLDRNQRYALIYDASQIGTVDSLTRKAYAEFMNKNEKDFRRLCVGCAFVITSAITRGALTAVLWVTGALPFPHKIFANRTEAENYAREQIRAGTTQTRTTSHR